MVVVTAMSDFSTPDDRYFAWCLTCNTTPDNPGTVKLTNEESFPDLAVRAAWMDEHARDGHRGFWTMDLDGNTQRFREHYIGPEMDIADIELLSASRVVPSGEGWISYSATKPVLPGWPVAEPDGLLDMPGIDYTTVEMQEARQGDHSDTTPRPPAEPT
jgi:hypothetical protein